MRYVMLDVRCDMYVNKGKIEYYVSEFSAVLTDAQVKTADTFTFFNESDYLRARAEQLRYGEKKVIVESIGEGYRLFREWLPEEACVIIWEHSVINVLNYCGGKAHLKKIRNAMVEMQTLYFDMTYQLKRKEALPLSECLKEQNLVCNMAEMKSSRYRAKAMLRLFRKMFMAGVRVLGNPFKDSVCDRKHKFIRSYVYFPELMVRQEKQRDLELKQKIGKSGYKCTVENGVVRIHTEYADYTFEIFDKRMEGQYTAHRFYKGERMFQVHFEQKLSMEQKIEKVIIQIKKIEKQAAYGVGNDEIAELLEKITRCSEYGCRS